MDLAEDGYIAGIGSTLHMAVIPRARACSASRGFVAVAVYCGVSFFSGVLNAHFEGLIDWFDGSNPGLRPGLHSAAIFDGSLNGPLVLDLLVKPVSKEIWLGPVLGNNRERLLARCAEYVSQGQAGRLLYIAASHPLLDLVTEKLLDGEQARGVWGEFPVYLFRGLVRRILSDAVVSGARPLGGPVTVRSPC